MATQSALTTFNFKKTLLNLKGHRVYEAILKYPIKLDQLKSLTVVFGDAKTSTGTKYWMRNKVPIIRFHNEHVAFKQMVREEKSGPPELQLEFKDGEKYNFNTNSQTEFDIMEEFIRHYKRITGASDDDLNIKT